MIRNKRYKDQKNFSRKESVVIYSCMSMRECYLHSFLAGRMSNILSLISMSLRYAVLSFSKFLLHFKENVFKM